MILGFTTCPDGLYQWGTGLRGVHRIQLPSITGKYGPGEKAYFPSNCGRKTKKLFPQQGKVRQYSHSNV